MKAAEIQQIEKTLENLRNKPDKGAAGKKKVDLLNQLAYMLHLSEPKRVLVCSKKALALAKRQNYAKGIAHSYNNIGIYYAVTGHSDRALKYCFKALGLFEKTGDKSGIAKIHNTIGCIYKTQGEYANALRHCRESLRIKEKMGDKSEFANVYTNIGVLYNIISEYDKALQYHLKALEIGEKTQDMHIIANAHNNIGNVYHYLGNNKLALEHYLKALKIRVKLGNKNHLAHAYNNVGVGYKEQGDYEKAQQYYHKSLAIRKEIGDRNGIAMSIHNIGEIFECQGRYTQALEWYEEALRITKDLKDKGYLAGSYYSVGRMHIILNECARAIRYLKKGVNLAKEIGAKKTERDCYESLSDAYKVKKSFKQALDCYRKFTNLDKDMFNTEKSKQLTEMRTKYETERKEKEAEIYHLKNVELRKEIKQRKKVEKALKKHRDDLEELVGQRTAELRSTNVDLEKEINERKRAEKELLSYQKQLRSLAHELSLVEERERRKIATSLHDNISQTLAIIKFKLTKLHEEISGRKMNKEMETVRSLVDKVMQRTRSMTFEISPPVLYELGFEAAVRWLIGQFQDQHGIECDFKDDGSTKPMNDDMRVILFQSVRELLANAYKHARAQSVSVCTLRDGDVVRIAVKDDGVGFDPRVLGQKVTKNEGFGLFNLRERLSHLQGDLKISSKIGEGTAITLVAPLKRARETAEKK